MSQENEAVMRLTKPKNGETTLMTTIWSIYCRCVSAIAILMSNPDSSDSTDKYRRALVANVVRGMFVNLSRALKNTTSAKTRPRKLWRYHKLG